MTLMDYTPVTRPVVAHGQTVFTVRGLSTADLAYLIEIHREQIVRAVMAYKNQNVSVFTPKGAEQTTLMLLTMFPQIAAEVISVAAGHRDSEAAKKATALPFTTQASTLHDVLTLTFDDAGGLKNLLATLAMLARAMFPDDVKSALLESLRATLTVEPSTT